MGNIITFYSYKGGVGRSMALANAGVILAQWGYRVLLIDFDLEAPGLENFFSSMLELSEIQTTPGVVDFICEYIDSTQFNPERWKEDRIEIRLPRTTGKLDLWLAGKKDQDYFKRVRRLDLPEFYSANNGGAFIEELRTKLKEEYDFVLVDSRTGHTEIGGLCTVQIPDMIVLLFTATEQAFQGGLDIITRASGARQKMPFDRVYVPTVPVPSRLDSKAEFRLSQQWLDRFARELDDIFAGWLPRLVNPRTLLDLIKLPHISFFSYGEALPVLEQGTTDPGGLAYAYETLTGLLARNLQEVESLLASRDDYIRKAARTERPRHSKESAAKIFISYAHNDKKWLDMLLKHLRPLARARGFLIWDDRSVGPGEEWREQISAALSEAEVAVLLVSPDYLASDFVLNEEMPIIFKAAQEQGLRIGWIAVEPSLYEVSEIAHFQSRNDPLRPLALLSPSQRAKAFVKISRRIAEIAGRSY